MNKSCTKDTYVSISLYKGLLLSAMILAILGSTAVKAQYINQVLEYKPAPGQLINEAPWGNPSSAQSVVGGINGHLSLGAFGGYVVFRFGEPVQNDPQNPFGIDFTIFGNPLPDWAEPAVVWVMNDENQNNLPDDTWYQLAGSDYHFSNTIHNYEVTYTNPGQQTATDVPWEDNQWNSGVIEANATHTQPYYPNPDSFPNINSNSYSLQGTCLMPELDKSNPAQVKIYKRGFGYADSQSRGTEPYTLPDNPYTSENENSGGDAFDISWAVDSAGNYIDLNQVHFIKVQSAVLANAGWLGEVSTEITGAVDVGPNPDVSGESYCIVIKDLPAVINTESIPLEAYVFHHGRLMSPATIQWQVTTGNGYIDAQNVLHLDSEGEIEVLATSPDAPGVSAAWSSTVDFSVGVHSFGNAGFSIYPVPASSFVMIEGAKGLQLNLIDARGHVLTRNEIIENKQKVRLDGIPKGLYLLTLWGDDRLYTKKIIKK